MFCKPVKFRNSQCSDSIEYADNLDDDIGGISCSITRSNLDELKPARVFRKLFGTYLPIGKGIRGINLKEFSHEGGFDDTNFGNKPGGGAGGVGSARKTTISNIHQYQCI